MLHYQFSTGSLEALSGGREMDAKKRESSGDEDTPQSMGSDGIPPRVMRELAEELVKLLSIIYQQSWLSGEFPDDWKLANVTPIHKKDRKENLRNYRPVNLTSVPGKVMKLIILSVIIRHLQDAQGDQTQPAQM
ncbi:RNA-directed DNA polymerase from mobile element jockey [Willisornis vidua]|uniref:RNA-directed DNA polymerase from mobile element jockey n=1 Tax=Willisornis vidua TaxID=1566151 RepID=A0ABQ9CUP9_9PASS|nr:RNA-directed DNA polymerase from mobile element jockey [Willisornis vidua]